MTRRETIAGLKGHSAAVRAMGAAAPRADATRARRIEDLSDEELAQIGEARVGAEHDHLNALLDDVATL